jgi:hypothetical protein
MTRQEFAALVVGSIALRQFLLFRDHAPQFLSEHRTILHDVPGNSTVGSLFREIDEVEVPGVADLRRMSAVQ